MEQKSSTLRTLGLVVKTTNYKETDLIVDIFSEERGIVTALAKGARKSKKRFFGGIEILDYGIFNLSKGQKNDLFFLDSLDKDHTSLIQIRNNLSSLKLSYIICEFLEKFFKTDGIKHIEIFSICIKFLKKCSTTANTNSTKLDPQLLDQILAVIGLIILEISKALGIDLCSLLDYEIKKNVGLENPDLKIFLEWYSQMSLKKEALQLKPRNFLIKALIYGINSLEQEMDVFIKSKSELFSFLEE